MCGITGFIDTRKSHSTYDFEATARAMISSLNHRGPDSSSVWIDNQNGVALGHARLSILDLSPAGAQPMMSHDGAYIISYNGEIYNYLEIAKELSGTGVSFRGNSDTEVLLEAISKWGIEKALNRANGMFAFAVWNRETKKLMIARDRMGKKPLYYGWQNGTFFFASELKALLKHPGFEPKIDRNALASYFRYSYIPTPLCIYKNISKLPQGSYALIDSTNESVGLSSYWSTHLALESKRTELNSISDKEAIEQSNQLIKKSVSMRLISDVPVGAFLSGGIDSSLVVSHMQTISAQSAKTFTIGFDVEKHNEAPRAKEIAKHLGTDHTEHYLVSDDLSNEIPQLADIYDEPFSDISQLPSYLVCKLARQDVTVCLSGDGGDEFFCGYNRYASAINKWDELQKYPRVLRSASAKILHAILPLADHNENWARSYRLLRCSSPVELFNLRNERLVNADQLVLGSERTPTPHTNLDVLSSNLDHPEQMMQLDIKTWLVDDILVKMDRASMANSLEVRNPLLDYEFATFAMSLPLHMKRRDGTSKWLLKECLKQYVPPSLTDGPKQGFSVPIRQWLKGPLREWAEDLLSYSRISQEGYLNPKTIKWLWNNFISGNNRYRNVVWSIIMFQAWLKRVQ